MTNYVWRRFLGNGLSSLTVSGGRLFTQVRRRLGNADREVCIALDASNGMEVWSVPVDDALYPDGGVGPDDGPRSTPVVSEGSVYVLGSYLKLLRLNATNGSVVWSNDLRALYGSTIIAWQNAASPVIENGRIFLNANATPGRIFALSTTNGAILWRRENLGLTQATPVLAPIHGVRQVIFATQNALVSLDPATGDRLWLASNPFPLGDSMAPSPVVCGDLVNLCAAHGYGMGAFTVRVTRNGDSWSATQLWYNRTNTSHWMTPVCHEGFLYGQFGIQQFDSANAQLKCVDSRTGEARWSVNGFGRGGTLLVNNRLLVLSERGHCVLVQPDTNAYVELARFVALTNFHSGTNRIWNTPALADGRLYVRSTAEVLCFDLSLPALRLDPPQAGPDETLRLTVRTVDASPLPPARAVSLEVRAGTNLALPFAQWTRLTNGVVLSNGVGTIEGVDTEAYPRRFFIINEPP